MRIGYVLPAAEGEMGTRMTRIGRINADFLPTAKEREEHGFVLPAAGGIWERG